MDLVRGRKIGSALRDMGMQNWNIQLYHFILGSAYGIPKCCIDMFLEHQKKGIMSALYQQRKHGKVVINDICSVKGQYAHCDKCIEKFKNERKTNTANRSLLQE